MTNTNYGSQELASKKESTEMEGLLSYTTDKNEKFANLIHRLEKVGHKLKDTNLPKEADMKGERVKPIGLLAEIGEQIERYNMQCNRLEEVIHKLESII